MAQDNTLMTLAILGVGGFLVYELFLKPATAAAVATPETPAPSPVSVLTSTPEQGQPAPSVLPPPAAPATATAVCPSGFQMSGGTCQPIAQPTATSVINTVYQQLQSALYAAYLSGSDPSLSLNPPPIPGTPGIPTDATLYAVPGAFLAHLIEIDAPMSAPSGYSGQWPAIPNTYPASWGNAPISFLQFWQYVSSYIQQQGLSGIMRGLGEIVASQKRWNLGPQKRAGYFPSASVQNGRLILR